MFFISFFKKSEKPDGKFDKPRRKSENSDGIFQKPKKESDKRKIRRTKLYSALVFTVGIAIALILVWAVYKVNYVPSKVYSETFGEYSLLASTQHEREEFFAQFGYTAESINHSTVMVPSAGEVFEEYNNLQLSQGLDLKPYMGRQAHQYVLRLMGKKGEEEVYGVLTVYRDRVISVHLSENKPGSPLRPLVP